MKIAVGPEGDKAGGLGGLLHSPSLPIPATSGAVGSAPSSMAYLRRVMADDAQPWQLPCSFSFTTPSVTSSRSTLPP